MSGLLFIPCCQQDLVKFNYDIAMPLKYFGEYGTSHLLSSSVSICSSSNGADTDPYNYSSSPGIKLVQQSHGKRMLHSCKICHKLFERPSTLKTHMNSHTGQRPFSCPNNDCNRSFSVRSNMMRHYRTCPYS